MHEPPAYPCSRSYPADGVRSASFGQEISFVRGVGKDSGGERPTIHAGQALDLAVGHCDMIHLVSCAQ